MTAPAVVVPRRTVRTLVAVPLALVAAGFGAMAWAWHDVAHTAVVHDELVAVVGALAGLVVEVCGLVLLATQVRRMSQARRRVLLDALIDAAADRRVAAP